MLGGSKCSKIEVWRGAARLLEASWAILASEVRPGRRIRPVLGASWSHHGAVLGRLWGALRGVEVSGGLPGVILLAQSATCRIRWFPVKALHLGCH